MAEGENGIGRIFLFPDLNNDPISRVKIQIENYARDPSVREVHLSLGSEIPSLFRAFEIYDYLTLCGKPTTVLASGLCTAPEILILQAGNNRLATGNTWFSLHPFITAGALNMPADQMVSASETITALDKAAKRIISARADIDMAELEELCRGYKLLSMSGALSMGKKGLVDGVAVSGMLRKTVLYSN